MPRFPSRSVRPLAIVLTLIVLCNTSTAQWGPFGNNCGCQPAIPPAASAPVFSQTAMANPCLTQSAAINPCPQLQPIQETVYRDVPVTEYRKEVRTVKKPVVRTVYEDKEVTAYRQIYEPRTVEVPSVQYQTISECKPVTVNRSYWRTVRQPVMKGCACDYDRRPTLMGWLNRQSYELRMAFTPNHITRREFVPNIQAYNVPVQRTVAVPTTREVTYNVAKLEPYTRTVKVARTYTDYEEREITVSVPFTTTKTVAVGTRTRMAYVDPYGSSRTATAPTADRTAEQRVKPKKQTSTNNSRIQRNSFEEPQRIQQAAPQQVPSQSAEPDTFGPWGEHGSTQPTPADADTDVAGWRPARKRLSTPSGPALSLASVN